MHYLLLLLFVCVLSGSLFAANIVEPTTLESGMVNVQFASNYIALLCPVREVSIKRWRLDHVTSFGQCGGTLTFECCVRCSDPLYNRCSLNIMHEKPAAILSLMEKVIRENPNTGEIHYERSILGDIYHCTHLCGGSPRMLPAYSDSNLFRIADSPMSIRRNGLESSMPPELHRSDFDMAEFHSNTLESNDSGLPGTPLLDESPRGSSILSSPTSSTGNSGSLSKSRESPPAADPRPRTQSDLSRYCRHPTRESVTPGRETEYSEGLNDTKKVTYSTVMHQPPQRQSSAMSGPSGGVTYTVLKQDSRMAMTPTPQTYNKLYPVVEDNAPLPPERKESRYRSSSTSPPNIMSPLPSPAILQKHQVNSFERRSDVRAPPPPPKLLHSSKEVSMPAGYHHSVAPLQSGDVRFEPLKDPFSDPDETDYDSPPQRGRVATQFTVRELPASMQRPRAQSQGEILYDSPRPSPVRSFRGTFGSTSREVDEVADSYKQNALEGSFSPFFRLDELEYDETDTEGAMEIVSNLADYRRSTDSQHHHSYCKPAVIDKVLSKVACDNVRGYAYKITIPMAGPTVVYDVPRRAAPLADPKSYNRNPEAPPKPLRNLSKSTELLDSLSA